MNMMESAKPAEDDTALPVSERIRARILNANQRFHANDNIASFIAPGETDALLDEVAAKMKGVLESLVIDTESDHNTHDTARRVNIAKVNPSLLLKYATKATLDPFNCSGHASMALLNELIATAAVVNRNS